MTLRFLPVGPRTLLVELPDLDATLALFEALAADPLPGIVEVIPAARTLMVRTASGCPADGRLAAALRRIYGSDLHLNVQLDPELVGGIRVEIGDEVIDGTMVARLDEARRRLVG